MTQLLETISADTDVFAFRKKLLESNTDPCVVAEAVETFPPNSQRSDDKAFTDCKKTNAILGQVFKALRNNPLTHAQFKYLAQKAHAAIAVDLNSDTCIPFDLILNNAYALAVHQIVVTYATRFGTAYAITRMYASNKQLHKDSEGSLKASDIVMRILHPPKTERGYAESLTAFVIRTALIARSPAYITNALKLRIDHHLSKDARTYTTSKFDPLSLYPLIDDSTSCSSGLNTAEINRKLTAFTQIRFDEIRFTIQCAIDELIKKAIEQETAQVAVKPVATNLDMYSVQALRALLNPANSHLVVNKAFHLQLFHLWPVLNMSRHKCLLIANHIVDTIRKHLGMTFHTDFVQRTQFKDRATRKRRELQPTCKIRDWAERETITVLVNTFTSPYVSKSDQDLLQLCISEGLTLF